VILFNASNLEVRPLPWWKVALIAGVAVAVTIALLLVAAGAVLILAPVIVAAAFILRLTLRRHGAHRDVKANPRANVITAEYEVIDESENAQVKTSN
jgi:hypothetical protein